uniref:Transposase n=1 Tax=Meloidogyne hapla TaxID=6305 RepID=A0A1I8B3Z7_MELHA
MPTPENEYLTNYKLAQILEIDNYTIKNYVVAMRILVTLLSVRNYRQIIFKFIIKCNRQVFLNSNLISTSNNVIVPQGNLAVIN